MVRPLEDIHQRGGIPISMATATIITTTVTIIATTPTILATTIIVTGIAIKRILRSSQRAAFFFRVIDLAADLRPSSSSK